MELSDLFYTYPAQQAPDFQMIITAKREFSELSSGPVQKPPAKGKLYKHQELIKRFMIQYDRILLFHRVGTGKTCSIFASSEKLKEGIIRAANNFYEEYMLPKRTNIKRIYILTRGDVLINELKRQLACVCTDGTYITDNVINATTERTQKIAVSKAISPYYDMVGYIAFANEIYRRRFTDEQLEEYFSDTLFVVDEIQNIRADDEILTNEESKKIYNVLHRLFHVIKRSKIIVASATPMVNGPEEIVDTMNLLLPLDRQMTTNEIYSLESVIPYFNGLISYVRELDTGVNPVFQGIKLNSVYQVGNDYQVQSQFYVFPNYMQGIQLNTYENVTSNKDTFYLNSRLASNFVFPDGTYNRDAFNRWMIKQDQDTYYPSNQLVEWLRSERLAELSSKFYNIASLCYHEPGLTFIYCDFVEAGGAYMLGAVLQSLGFDRFADTKSPFVVGESSLRPFCANSTVEKTIKIVPKLRFAIITSKTTPAKFSNILELFNSNENRYGDYIKILIGSPASKIGLNLANVVNVHIVGPAWNQSNNYQAIGRAIRSTSHVSLLKEAKLRAIEKGENPDNVRIVVKIYQHAAVTPSGNSTDSYIYQLSEEKDIMIHMIERFMKVSSFDCQINYERNVRESDEDYTPQCDYDVCRYQCINNPPSEFLKKYELSSYNTLYADELNNRIKEILTETMNQKSLIRITELQSKLPDIMLEDIYIALDDLVANSFSMLDRFGFDSFVCVDKDVLYLQRDYPSINSKRANNYYVNNLIFLQLQTLTDVAMEITTELHENIIQFITNLNPESDEFRKTIESLPLSAKVSLLEEAIINITKNGDSWAKGVVKIFYEYVFIFQEPVYSILNASELLYMRAKGRGRKPKEGRRKIKKKTVNIDERDIYQNHAEEVYIHTLYIQNIEQLSYNVVSNYINAEGRKRIYKPSENLGFRDTNAAETPVYTELIRRTIEETVNELNRSDIYGIVLYDGMLRIRDTSNLETVTDARKINRGKLCVKWKKPELIYVMYRLGIAAPNTTSYLTDEYIDSYLRSTMKNTGKIKIDEMSPELKRYFASWYIAKTTVSDGMCNLIKQKLQELGRLYTL